MSGAEQMSTGRFDGEAQRLSSAWAAGAAAIGVPTDGLAAPTELPVDRISLNPDNPRSSLGDLTQLAGSLKEHGQKQAITVMNRHAYVKANPQSEAKIDPNATHVVIDGSSRLAAARVAGLATVKVLVDDEQGADEDALLESALVANIHRQDLDPLDEARALFRLKAIYGTQEALAARLHRSQGWVSQRLALLNLTPQLQERIGQEPIDLLRAVGKKPAEEQELVLERLKRQRAEKEAARQATRKARSAAPTPAPTPTPAQPPVEAEHYGVMKTPAAGTAVALAPGDIGHYAVMNREPGNGHYGVMDPPGRDGHYGVIEGAVPDPSAQPTPEHRPADVPAWGGQPGARRQIKMPWDDGVACAEIAIQKMSREQRARMIQRLLEQQRTEEARRPG
ncbi:ParB/RepB/Spo0J family partition protein [Streptomyces sp. ISL-22]|uniref:ParB/RepB/Spo0J family partition protein n=1 Tax=unclassified Streptomyces TaxID=2593676 RepID=UPI001BE539B5|nr:MULTISPECIES: ParB/RepB/Spo0J family partition protein [unclassified Streptomyces]MBT2417991.1 ParB/RepB/Spo0J family partition protein [Streptomyces sp. ISL-24]MBT2432334.1 ParB/RepB/Spo0J family partition protein [Streptomyces sp. ISL-22]